MTTVEEKNSFINSAQAIDGLAADAKITAENLPDKATLPPMAKSIASGVGVAKEHPREKLVTDEASLDNDHAFTHSVDPSMKSSVLMSEKVFFPAPDSNTHDRPVNDPGSASLTGRGMTGYGQQAHPVKEGTMAPEVNVEANNGPFGMGSTADAKAAGATQVDTSSREPLADDGEPSSVKKAFGAVTGAVTAAVNAGGRALDSVRGTLPKSKSQQIAEESTRA